MKQNGREETMSYTLNGENGGEITTINMTLSTTDCDEPCNVIITVTWQNTDNKSAKFNPAIMVNGNKIILSTEIILHKNDTTTQVFNLTNLMEGTYKICPYPN